MIGLRRDLGTGIHRRKAGDILSLVLIKLRMEHSEEVKMRHDRISTKQYSDPYPGKNRWAGVFTSERLTFIKNLSAGTRGCGSLTASSIFGSSLPTVINPIDAPREAL